MGMVLVIGVVVGIYLGSLVVLPWWTCPGCNDSKRASRHRGRAHGRCLRCKGEGRYPRIGVRILMPGMARNMREGKKGLFY